MTLRSKYWLLAGGLLAFTACQGLQVRQAVATQPGDQSVVQPQGAQAEANAPTIKAQVLANVTVFQDNGTVGRYKLESTNEGWRLVGVQATADGAVVRVAVNATLSKSAEPILNDAQNWVSPDGASVFRETRLPENAGVILRNMVADEAGESRVKTTILITPVGEVSSANSGQGTRVGPADWLDKVKEKFRVALVWLANPIGDTDDFGDQCVGLVIAECGQGNVKSVSYRVGPNGLRSIFECN